MGLLIIFWLCYLLFGFEFTLITILAFGMIIISDNY